MNPIGPGSEVVCINDDWTDLIFVIPSNAPIKNNVYKVLNTVDFSIQTKYNCVGLYLQLAECYPDQYCWAADHFRLVRKTDISSLRALLVTPPGAVVRKTEDA